MSYIPRMPRPKRFQLTRQLTIRLTPEVRRLLFEAAARSGDAPSEFVRKAVLTAIKSEGTQAAA